MGLLRWFNPVTQPSQSSTLPAELGSASRDKIKLSISSRIRVSVDILKQRL